MAWISLAQLRRPPRARCSLLLASGLFASACGGSFGSTRGADASDGGALEDRTDDGYASQMGEGGDCTVVIEAVSYNQSCAVDSDCIGVGQGNTCDPCNFVCGGGGAISAVAYAQYTTDVARSVGDTSGVRCACPSSAPPCCLAGRCERGASCGPGAPIVDAAPQSGEASAGLCASPTCEAGSGPTQDAMSLTGIDGSVVDLGGICADAGNTAMAADPAASDAGGTSAGGCTRRPAGTSNTFQCPVGLGEYVAKVIGPAGGTLEIQGRQYLGSGVTASLAFPPTAFAAPTTVVLTETAIPPPHDFLDWSPVYRVEPLGLALASPTPVRFPWSNVGFSVPRNLAIWFSLDGSCFTPLPDSYVNAAFNQGSTSTLGYFIV